MNSDTIVAARDLITASEGYYSIQVVVVDKGNPALTSTGVVEITVGNPSVPSVSFQRSEYHVEIPEDMPNGQLVTRVQAEQNSVTYSFASGNEGNMFNIDINTGAITVRNTNLIDYETNPRLRLVVRATVASQHAYATLWVNLTDVNDNDPIFTQSKYISSVWENNAFETYVTMVKANDADSETNGNGVVTYNIIKGNDDDAFVIDPPHTGIVKTKLQLPLDWEITKTYRLLVEAVDHGSPPRSSTCTLRINVIDENDNGPYFPPYPPVQISENRRAGYQVITVTATDVDFQPKLVYNFIEDVGNPDNVFSIDRFSGSISLAKPVDYEVRQFYRMGIKVDDGKFTAPTYINVTVLDENDNAPEFSQQNYQVALDDLTPTGHSVITVVARDADSGINSMITYSLRSTFNDSFYVDPTNGTIITNKVLRKETFSSIIELVVIAQDGGSPKLSDMVAVHIQITDINQFAPEFEQRSYLVHVNESLTRGMFVLHVTATDRDDLNSHRDDNIHYRLQGEGASTFQIRQKTGEIFLMGRLNRENISQYNLTAIATDRGKQPKSTSVSMTVIVTDVNDNPPRFHQTDNIYHVQLPEDYEPAKVFQNVTADDADEGIHAEIQYTITSGNNEGIFHIHNTDGGLLIMVMANLDYEKHTSHRLIVRAVDCSKCGADQPRLSAFVTIEINVTDVNECAPEFPISPYNECVMENQPVGTTVFQAQANDCDGGKYGVLHYSIVADSSLDAHLFRINSSTGHVLTQKTFDYETLPNEYTFQIRAEDISGNSSTVDVIVNVLDVDEYTPVFVEQSYSFKVLGSAKAGTYVGQVRASDQDKGNAGKVVYMIENSHDYFEINAANGTVTVKRSFHENAPARSRRKRALTGESETLVIRASSGREDSLSATTRVEVDINRDCDGCVYVPQIGPEPMTPVAVVMTIVVCILVIVAVVIVIICLLRRRRIGKRPPHDPNESEENDFSFTPPPALRPPIINGGPPPYKDHLQFGANASNVTSSDISDHSHNSASSGRGSAEEEEDEEIRMINSHSNLHNSQTYMLRKQMPDSGIQQDDDTLSEPSVQNHQEYLARLGIDSTKIGKPKPKPGITHSVESMHQFSDEGGGEGNVDMGHSDYDKMTDMETDEEVAMIDRNKDQGFHEPEAQHAGSLSSVINSEEEYSGSYNWDYLLNWGPQYQPLAHVFAEIAKLKDDTVQPRKLPVRTVQQRHINTSLTPPKVKSVPPPMITNAPPKAFAPRPSHTSSGSSSHPNSARASTMNTSLPSLPRSPISYDSSVTSPALTPSFTPSLSPLATGSPSPVVSAHGSAHGSNHSSGHNTPGKSVSKQKKNGRLALSASSESEQEFRI